MRSVLVAVLLAGSSIAVADVRSETTMPTGISGDIEVGFVARRMSFGGPAPSSSVARETQPMTESALLDTAGLRLRVMVGAANGFYGGGDGDALGASDGVAMLMHGVVGWRHLFDRGLVSGELALGGGIAQYAGTTDGQLVSDVEARIGLAHFIGSMVVVGTELGTSPLDRGAFSVGVMVGVLGDGTHAWHRRPQ